MSETAVMEIREHPRASGSSRSLGGADAEREGRLVARAQDGDAGAFDRLMRLHERRVFGLAWRLLGSVEDAQDAAQEVFLKLYRHLHRVDPRRPLEAWLYRVTVNACHDLGRRRRSRQERLVPLATGESVREIADERVPDPAAAAALGEERRMVTEGLATLADKERAALVLRDVQGLRTAEVAAALGSSEVTVRTQICRARIKLKKFRDRFFREVKR